MIAPRSPAEYHRRVDLSIKVISQAARRAGFKGYSEVAENYMGVEFSVASVDVNGPKVRTDTINGMVNVLFVPGHGPRFPQKITFSVGAHVRNYPRVQKNRVWGSMWQKDIAFLPDQIDVGALVVQMKLARKWVIDHLNQDYVRQLLVEKSQEAVSVPS